MIPIDPVSLVDSISLADEVRARAAWRDWAPVFRALPSLQGKTVLDLGCGAGEVAAALVAKGARVVGVDSNPELLESAGAKGLPWARFVSAELSALPSPAELELDQPVDGIWCSFAAAYLPDLDAALEHWQSYLAPGGWIALVEVDDLFGHRPLSEAAIARFDAYADDSLAASRYDFRMGRRLRGHLETAGFEVTRSLELQDAELAFNGPAPPAVIAAWGRRFERMRLLREFLGDAGAELQAEFLECLSSADHRSVAKVCCCVGVAPGATLEQ